MRLTYSSRTDYISRFDDLTRRIWQTYADDVMKWHAVVHAVTWQLSDFISAHQLLRGLADANKGEVILRPVTSAALSADNNGIKVLLPDPPGNTPYAMTVRLPVAGFVETVTLSNDNPWLPDVMRHVSERNRIYVEINTARSAFICAINKCKTEYQLYELAPDVAKCVGLSDCHGSKIVSGEDRITCLSALEVARRAISKALILPPIEGHDVYKYTLS